MSLTLTVLEITTTSSLCVLLGCPAGRNTDQRSRKERLRPEIERLRLSNLGTYLYDIARLGRILLDVSRKRRQWKLEADGGMIEGQLRDRTGYQW